MNSKFIALSALLVFALFALPVSAFNADKLSITIDKDGNADIQFRYSQLTASEISLYENPLIPKEATLLLATKMVTRYDVSYISICDEFTDATVIDFATVSPSDKKTKYVSPAINFMAAKRPLDTLGFFTDVSPDYSPSEITVRFPSPGNSGLYTFHNVNSIPSITHEK